MEIDAVYGDKDKKGKHVKGKKGKDKSKGKHKGKHEGSLKFLGYCGHCAKWEHKHKSLSKLEHYCWDELAARIKSLSTSWFVFSWNRTADNS